MIQANQEFVFSADEHRKNGIKLRITTIKDFRKSLESMLIIASTRKIDLTVDYSIEHPTITDLMRELAGFDNSDWIEKNNRT
jgi:hypothetical protein